jgi:large subunit ribosomal protein L5
MAKLKKDYIETIRPALCKELEYKNLMQAPRLSKIVVNIGVDAQVDKDTFKLLNTELGQITGQRPAITKARKSVSNFRLREGMPIGAKVTLRGDRMYEFLERLISAALPRIRDFRGISKTGFDGRGNYNLGITEQAIFPEINPDRIKKTQGMDISFVTTAATDTEGRALLTHFGMPFEN